MDSLLAILLNRGSITACTGGLLFVITEILRWQGMFSEEAVWNVMGLFFEKCMNLVKAPAGWRKKRRIITSDETFRLETK